MKKPKPWSHLRRLPRYREVANILIKHGFGTVLDRINLKDRLKFSRRDPLEEHLDTIGTARRLRVACEELGPTFVKLGQLLSTRADLLSPEYINELQKLQDDVPPFSFEQVLEVCAGEGLDVEELFLSVDPEPVAAGSIGQVHRAVLRSGEEVILKVKRPGIDQVVATDLDILFDLSLRIERRSAWPKFYRLHDIVEELGEALHNELDFRKEARNADKFFHNFKNDHDVIIPRVYWAYSSEKILTMEYLQGIKISDYIDLKKAGYNPHNIVQNLVNALFQQIYVDGFFHADPHPGNIAVAEGEKLIFYDFGQVGMIDNFTREKYIKMVIAMMRYDVNGVTRALLDLAMDSGNVYVDDLRREVAKLEQKYYGMPLAAINAGEALAEILDLSMRHQMRMPAELSLLAKMLLTLESLVAQLDPGISLVDIAKPYGKKALKQRYSPRRVKAELQDLLIDYADLVRNLPRDVSSLTRKLEQGELEVKMRHSNLPNLLTRMDVISNRLVLAIILASIVIGSSLIVNQSGDSFLTGLPLVEGGFVLAVVLGLFLAYSILKSGRY